MPARWHCPRYKAEYYRAAVGCWRHCQCYDHRHTPTPPGSGMRANGIVIRAVLCDGTKIYRPEFACCVSRQNWKVCECGRELKEDERPHGRVQKCGLACPGKKGRRMDVKVGKDGEYEFWGFGRKAEVVKPVEGRKTVVDEKEEGEEELVKKMKPRHEPRFSQDDPIKEGRDLFEGGVPLPQHEPEARVTVDSGLLGLEDIDDPETWSEDRQLAELYRLGILDDPLDVEDNPQPHEAPFRLSEIHRAGPGFKVQRVARKPGWKKGQVRWWSEVDEVDDDRGLTEGQLDGLQRLWEAEAFDFIVDEDISSIEGSWTDAAEV